MSEYCDEGKEKSPLYIDGTYRETEEDAFMRGIKETAKTLPGLAVTDDFRENLRNRLEQEAAKPKARLVPLWKQAAGFVAAAAVIAISVISFGNLPEPDVTAPQDVASRPVQEEAKQAETPALADKPNTKPKAYEEATGVSADAESGAIGPAPRFVYATKAQLCYTFDASSYDDAKAILSGYELDGAGYRVPVDMIATVCEQLENFEGYVGHRPSSESPEAETEEEKELFGNFVWVSIEMAE